MRTSRRAKELLTKAQAQAEQIVKDAEAAGVGAESPAGRNPGQGPRAETPGNHYPGPDRDGSHPQEGAGRSCRAERKTESGSVAKEVDPRAKELLAKAQAQAEQIVKDAEAQAAEITARQQEILEKNFEEKRKELFTEARAEADRAVIEARKEAEAIRANMRADALAAGGKRVQGHPGQGQRRGRGPAQERREQPSRRRARRKARPGRKRKRKPTRCWPRRRRRPMTSSTTP